MKKLYFIICFLFILITSAFCKEQVYLYAASSIKKPIKEIVKKFNLENSKKEIILITGGSGQLLNKILISKKADIYIPASQDFLYKSKKLKISKSVDLLYQTPVFGISDNYKDKIKDFNDLVKFNIKIALGKPETMALGKIYNKIETKLPQNIANQIREKTLIYAINISQIVNYLKSNIVDAGILFDSTARVNNISYIEIPNQYNNKIKVKMALLNFAESKENSEVVFNCIIQNKEIFSKYGFEVVSK